MRNLQLLLLCCILGFVYGCADSSTKGAIKEVETDIHITITSNEGTVNIDPSLGLDASAGDTTQDTEDSATVSPDTTAAIGMQGSTASNARDGAEMFMEQVRSAWDNYLDRSDRSVDNTDNSTVTPPVVTPEGEVIDGGELVPTSDNQEIYQLRQLDNNNKMFTWLQKSGKTYGATELTFYFPGCEDAKFVVPDARVKHGADGDAGNYNQMYYFSGNPETQEETMGGCGDWHCASVFGPPGCVTNSVVLTY